MSVRQLADLIILSTQQHHREKSGNYRQKRSGTTPLIEKTLVNIDKSAGGGGTADRYSSTSSGAMRSFRVTNAIKSVKVMSCLCENGRSDNFATTTAP